MLDKLERPSLEARRNQPCLLFSKIYCSAVFIEKDKYLTPAHSSKVTRSSHLPGVIDIAIPKTVSALSPRL